MASSETSDVPSSPTPIYVLDTNVLVQDPHAIFKFGQNNIVIPLTVIEELDNFKKLLDEKGRAAREVARQLDALRQSGSLRDGVLLPDGGLLYVSATTLESGCNDNKIIATAQRWSANHSNRVVLVSRDMNVRIKADAVGLEAEDFESAHIEISDDTYTGIRRYDASPDEIDDLHSEGFMPVPDEVGTMYENEVLHMACGKQSGICVFSNGYLHRMELPSEVFGLQPRNLEQSVALNHLLDPEIKLVTLAGIAGTGKTLLAIAAGLGLLPGLPDDSALYEKVVVSRPVIPMGKDIGYLPGTMQEKMDPWMRPIYDNLEFLVNSRSRRKAKKSKSRGNGQDRKPVSNYQYLLDTGMVEVEALTYIRGRSIPYQYLLIDEAQNLTAHEVKTILTRAGEGTKVVLTGDPAQIDTPYVDSRSNGLTYAIEKFKHHPIAAHVTLTRGERSQLAALAAELL